MSPPPNVEFVLHLQKGLNMNEIVLIFLAAVTCYGVGYYAGNSDGKVEGRMAVRRHYEDRERQLKANR